MKSLLAFWIAMSVALGVAMPSHADPQPKDTAAPAVTAPAAVEPAVTAPLLAVPAVTAPVAAPATPSTQKVTTFRPKKQNDEVRIKANKALKEISDLKKADKNKSIKNSKDQELVNFLKAREKQTPSRDALYQDLKFRDELWDMLLAREERIKNEADLVAHPVVHRELVESYKAPQESVVATPDRATEAALAKCNEQCRAKIAEANKTIKDLNDELNRAKEDIATRKTPSTHERDRDDDSTNLSARSKSRNGRMNGTNPQSILAELFGNGNGNGNGNGLGNNMFNPMGQQQGLPGQYQQPMWPGQQQQPFGMGNRFLPNMYPAQQQAMNPWGRNNMNMPQQSWPQQGGQFSGVPFTGGQFAGGQFGGPQFGGGQFGGGAQWGGQRPAPGVLPMPGQQQQFGLGTQFGIGSGFGSTIYNGGQNGGYNYAGNLNQNRSLPSVYAAPRPY